MQRGHLLGTLTFAEPADGFAHHPLVEPWRKAKALRRRQEGTGGTRLPSAFSMRTSASPFQPPESVLAPKGRMG